MNRSTLLIICVFLSTITFSREISLSIGKPGQFEPATCFMSKPLEIVNWDVVIINKQVHATWKVINDVNVARYEVEKSAPGSNFDLLKAVSPMRQSQTSTYGVIDRMPGKGWNYYRLKITDDEGKVSYTSVKKILMKEEAHWGQLIAQPDLPIFLHTLMQ